jgi:lysophospholipase L1-like esterase
MGSRRSPPAWRVLKAFALAILNFALIEAAVQVRSQWRYGYSMLTVMEQQSMYLVDEATGLKLLRPRGVFVHNQRSVASNSLGLRGPEVASVRSPHSVRIAIVGASTVMGVTASDNDHTFPALLQKRLHEHLPGVEVEVINAGISGYALADEQAMLERRVAPLRPDLVVLYPGFNDFADYCQSVNGRRKAAWQGLPVLALPEWWLSDDLVLKNTTSLRRVPHAAAGDKNPDAMNLAPYQAKVRNLIDAANRVGVQLVVATVARNFRREQPWQTQQQLSADIRSLLPCFSVEGMHRLFERHNEILETEARAARLLVIEMDRLIPGGPRNFSNVTHFADAGEVVAADVLADFLTTRHLLDPGAPH